MLRFAKVGAARDPAVSGNTGATGPAGFGGSGITAVWQSGGNTNDGQCIGLYPNGGAHATCPTATAVDFDYNLAVPAGGTTISGLYAQSKAAPAAGKSYVINVRDNGSTVLSCTVGATATSCSQSGNVAVTGGHFIQVQITTPNAAANNDWRAMVSFSP